MLYNKQIELPEGRKFGCLQSGPLQSFGKYEAIRSNKQVIRFIVTKKLRKIIRSKNE
jgi:hypothetical protein